MSNNLPYACRLCKLFISLEEDGFIYGFDKRDGNTFLLCQPCKNDLERALRKKITRSEFGDLIRKRWEKGELETWEKIKEAKKRGWEVEVITGSKSPETISCCQLVEQFSELEEDKKNSQHSMFLDILNNLERKDKLCSKCLEFRNNLEKKLSSDG